MNHAQRQSNATSKAYPFIVVGCMVARMGDRERTSQETRYYVLDTHTGKKYGRVDERGDNSGTFAFSNFAQTYACGLRMTAPAEREEFEWKSS